MGNIKIVRGVFDTKLELEHAGVGGLMKGIIKKLYYEEDIKILGFERLLW